MKAAPRAPTAGMRPNGPAATGRPTYAGRTPPGAGGGTGAAYAGRPGYAGRPAYFAHHPGFARRAYGGRYYRGSLAWEGGRWRHEWRNGRYGWWWDVG